MVETHKMNLSLRQSLETVVFLTKCISNQQQVFLSYQEENCCHLSSEVDNSLYLELEFPW